MELIGFKSGEGSMETSTMSSVVATRYDVSAATTSGIGQNDLATKDSNQGSCAKIARTSSRSGRTRDILASIATSPWT